MDILLYSLQVWYELPAPLKLITISPNVLFLPIQTTAALYKGYKWLYPPKPKTTIYIIESETKIKKDKALALSFY